MTDTEIETGQIREMPDGRRFRIHSIDRNMCKVLVCDQRETYHEEWIRVVERWRVVLADPARDYAAKHGFVWRDELPSTPEVRS